MKPPSYSPREYAALAAADRVVIRRWHEGRWIEAEFKGAVVPILTTVQKFLADHPRESEGIILYVGGMVNGERMLANVRREG